MSFFRTIIDKITGKVEEEAPAYWPIPEEIETDDSDLQVEIKHVRNIYEGGNDHEIPDSAFVSDSWIDGIYSKFDPQNAPDGWPDVQGGGSSPSPVPPGPTPGARGTLTIKIGDIICTFTNYQNTESTLVVPFASAGVGGILSDEWAEKLSNIEYDAQKNVQPDWNVTDTTSDAYIKNKPPQRNLVEGDGISITQHGNDVIISCTASGGSGYGPKYHAGDHIEIDSDNYISAVGLQPSGDYVEWVEMGEYVDEKTSGYVTLSQLSDYVTKDYFDEHTENFITEDDIRDLATTEYVDEKTSGLQPSGDYVEFLDMAEYVDEMTSGAITSGDLEPYAAKEYVDEELLKKQDKLHFGYDESGRIISIDSSAVGGGGGSSYTPGEYISIHDNIISATGLQPSGDYLEPSDLNGYATEDFVESKTSGKLDSSAYSEQIQSDWNQNDSGARDFIKNKPEIPSLDGYATEAWVDEQGFLTEVPAQYVTDEELEAATSGLQPSGDYLTPASLNGYATQQWVNEQGFLTEVPSEYATDAEVAAATSGKLDSSSYVSPVQSDWNQNDSGSLDFIKNKPVIPSLAGYATESWVNEQGFLTSGDLDDYATESYVDDSFNSVADYVEEASGNLAEQIIRETSGKADRSDVHTYSAGQNISIINDVISVSGSTTFVDGPNTSIVSSGDNWAVSAYAPTSLGDLLITAGISDIQVVQSLPADASGHPEIMYCIPVNS